MGRSSRLAVLSWLAAFWLAGFAQGELPPAEFYLERCSSCHTIGQEEEALDLTGVAHWPKEDLRAAVIRMEENAGPMSAQTVEGLVELLQSADLQERLASAEAGKLSELASDLDKGSAGIGRRLFYGNDPLARRGTPCFACHAVAGEGGTLAADLTYAHRRMGMSSLLSATERPGFPLMKSSYASKPVTPQEALHLAAFFEESAAQTPAQAVATPRFDGGGTLLGSAAGLIVLVFGGVALLSRSRRAGVRSRLVRGPVRRRQQ
jgi:mono/diheme cytochrome c family protein